MAYIEIEQFSLRPACEWGEFRRLDAELQAWSHVHRSGLLRRTTGYTEAGEIVVVTLLVGATTPGPPDPDAPEAAAVRAFDHVVDPASYRRAVYRDLE